MTHQTLFLSCLGVCTRTLLLKIFIYVSMCMQVPRGSCTSWKGLRGGVVIPHVGSATELLQEQQVLLTIELSSLITTLLLLRKKWGKLRKQYNSFFDTVCRDLGVYYCVI